MKLETGRRGIGGPKTEEEEGLAVLEQTIGCSYAKMLDRMRSRLGKHYENVIHAERFIDVHLHRAVRALQAKHDKECDKSKNELRSIPFHEGLHP